MATTNITTTLDVMSKYISLVNESLGTDSIYIRTKETVEQLAANGDLSDVQKAEIIANVLTSVNTSVVNASMSTALEWAKSEKSTALQLAELEKQLDILAAELLLKGKDLELKGKDLELKGKELELADEQKDKLLWDNVATQAQTKRMYGTPTVDVNGVVIGLAEDGKITTDIELLAQQVTNAVKEGELLDKKKKESEAAIHKVIADTYWNYGSGTFTIDEDGVTDVQATFDPNFTPLMAYQAEIAKEQANGYAYNAWANALTGSASFLATGIASEADIFATSTDPGNVAMDVVLGAAQRLITADAPYNTLEDNVTVGDPATP